MAAYRLPKASDDEKAARTRAIQSALQDATVVPLDTLRACAHALAHARVVAEHGNASAASDAGVAIGLLRAAAAGADANVRINLGESRTRPSGPPPARKRRGCRPRRRRTPPPRCAGWLSGTGR